MKTKTETFWIITGSFGRMDDKDRSAYTGTFFTRSEAIKEHCESYSPEWQDMVESGDDVAFKKWIKKTWAKKKREGDRVVRATLTFPL